MRARPAILGIFRQRHGDKTFECSRRTWHREARRAVRAASRHHFEDDRAEGEKIGARVGWGSFELLGRHVGQRAEHLSVRGDRRGARRFNDDRFARSQLG